MIYDTTAINALVLAGGINRIILFEGYQPGYKGLLPFRGKPIIQYTLDALTSTQRITRICIVGPAEKIKKTIADPERYEFVNGGATLIENIKKGLEHFESSTAVLVIPSDLPLVTPEAITDFLEQCGRIDTTYAVNIFWSMVPEENFSGVYRKVKKGFNRFRDISVCHGNLLLMTPSLVDNASFAARMETIYHARKSSIRAALAVGPITGLSYLIGVHILRILTISQFARIASAAFRVGLIPIKMHYPEIAMDIDEARDYDFISDELDRRTSGKPA